MAWRKSPQTLIDLFDGVVPSGKRIERRKMFGYPAAFVNGNLFAGLHQEDFILRLDEAERKVFIRTSGSRIFEPMPGRRMREYVVVPEAVLADKKALGDWISRSIAFASAIKPKSASRAKKPKAASRAKKPKPTAGAKKNATARKPAGTRKKA